MLFDSFLDTVVAARFVQLRLVQHLDFLLSEELFTRLSLDQRHACGQDTGQTWRESEFILRGQRRLLDEGLLHLAICHFIPIQSVLKRDAYID